MQFDCNFYSEHSQNIGAVIDCCHNIFMQFNKQIILVGLFIKTTHKVFLVLNYHVYELTYICIRGNNEIMA